MKTKRYLSIKEVSKLLDIKEHVIRYWDSIDPSTNKLRIDGISTKSRAGTRYFNKDNIAKIKNLKKILYNNGEQYNPLKLAKKLINKDNFEKNTSVNFNSNTDFLISKNDQKFIEILKKMRILLK